MARIHIQPVPVTVAAVAPPVRHSTTDPEDRQVSALGTMDAKQFRYFEETLRRWKAEGVRLTWTDLQRAAKLARGEP